MFEQKQIEMGASMMKGNRKKVKMRKEANRNSSHHVRQASSSSVSIIRSGDMKGGYS